MVVFTFAANCLPPRPAICDAHAPLTGSNHPAGMVSSCAESFGGQAGTWIALRFSPCGLRCSRSLRFARVESLFPCPGVARMGEDGSAIFFALISRQKNMKPEKALLHTASAVLHILRQCRKMLHTPAGVLHKNEAFSDEATSL